MTRSLTAGVIAEIATNKLNPVELIYLGISTGTYYTDHYKDISFDGNTYVASSLFMGLSEVTENAEVAVNSLSLRFTGADQTIISLFLNNDYMDKEVTVYRGFLNDSQALITDPFLLFQGRIENFNIEDDETSSSVLISVASHWADFDKVKSRKTNTNSQKLHFSTDKGFDYASKSVRDIKWGRA